MAPAQMKAYVVQENKTAGVEQKPVPKPKADEVLIKNHAVTLNPTDWKHIAFISPPGVIVGCDFAGTVEELGSSVSNGLKQGDRVSGFVHGAKYEHNGSFAEYVVAKAQNVMKVPSSLDDAGAASMGIAALTAIQAVHQRLEVPAPSKDISSLPKVDKSSPKLLVWSGATAVGQYAVQLGRIAGYYVITTASEKNHDFLQKYGAQEVYDYKDPEVTSKISKAHPDLDIALDCISENGSQQLVVKSLGEKKSGKVIVLLGVDKEAKALRSDVEIVQTLIYTSLGDEFKYFHLTFGADQVSKDQAFFKPWLNGDGLLSHLFEKKLLQPNRIKHLDGGIDGISQGLEYLKSGKASGEKLAFKLA